MFREMKPGAAEILDMVKSLNSEYPSIKVAREAINALFRQHQEKIKEDLEKQGMAYSSQLDPWKGIFNYKFVEYRDASGKFVEENKAREKSAELWVWREDNPSMPNVSAGSRKKSVRDPVHPNYRFYRPRHPKTNELCTPPKRGWVWPKSKLDGFTGCFDDYAEDDRIAWGPDEKKIPQLKKFLHETETQVSKSAIVDYTDGEKELTDLTGNTRSFPNPKPSTLIRKFISQTTNEADWVMDIFAGSGTTLHSVLRASSEDKKGRKTMLIEGGNHFEELVVPRTKKLAASLNWKLGELGDFGGPGLFMRVQALEQYEDTLENLDTGDAGQLDFKFYDPAFTLRYGLNQESKAVYCSIGHFKSPFGYQLQRVEGGGKAVSRPVDLVESLVYLMGLKVSRMIREAAGVVITGSDPRNRSVAAFFRDCDHENSMAWVEQKLHEHPADRVVTNDPAGLHFEGCERFEAIESFFAGQFGGR